MDLITLGIGVVLGVVFAVPLTAFYKNNRQKAKDKFNQVFDK
jgi:uncharacterized membrane protein